MPGTDLCGLRKSTAEAGWGSTQNSKYRGAGGKLSVSPLVSPGLGSGQHEDSGDLWVQTEKLQEIPSGFSPQSRKGTFQALREVCGSLFLIPSPPPQLTESSEGQQQVAGDKLREGRAFLSTGWSWGSKSL